jgi:L-ornithine N5-oxygenase
VIGASQSAAEIALDLLRRGFAKVHVVHRSFSFQQKDTSPFSDEVYFPEFVDYFHKLPAAARQSLGQELRRTNYSSVDKDVLDELYRLTYQHSLAGRMPLTIHRNFEIAAIEPGELHQRLTIRERYTGCTVGIDFALAILATGFLDIGMDGREAVPAVLRDVCDRFLWTEDGLSISRNYAVSFAEGEPFPPLFLNGLCEATHGLGDAGSFSLVSIRARDILSSIREEMSRAATAADESGRSLR